MITLLLSLSLMTAEPGPSPGPSFEARCALEVEELHTFFQQWFEGSLPETDEAFARFADAMAPEFRLLFPTGNFGERAAIIEALRKAHGSRPPDSEDRVWVEDVQVVASATDLAVVTYIERQIVEGSPRDRRSTAIFRQQAGTPNGVAWVHLHETWLPKAEQGRSAQTAPSATPEIPATPETPETPVTPEDASSEGSAEQDSPRPDP